MVEGGGVMAGRGRGKEQKMVIRKQHFFIHGVKYASKVNSQHYMFTVLSACSVQPRVCARAYVIP